jgi:tetratricopeptide (TPR) repeat protein
MGKFKKAQDVLSKAAQIAHPSPSTLDPFAAGKLANEHFEIGNKYLELGLNDEAIEEYRKALKLSPKLADVLTKLGIALRNKNLYEEAILQFSKAKEVNPRYGPAWVQLGITYYLKGLVGLAVEEWENALKLNPNLEEAKLYMRLLNKTEE